MDQSLIKPLSIQFSIDYEYAVLTDENGSERRIPCKTALWYLLPVYALVSPGGFWIVPANRVVLVLLSLFKNLFPGQSKVCVCEGSYLTRLANYIISDKAPYE